MGQSFGVTLYTVPKENIEKMSRSAGDIIEILDGLVVCFGNCLNEFPHHVWAEGIDDEDIIDELRMYIGDIICTDDVIVNCNGLVYNVNGTNIIHYIPNCSSVVMSDIEKSIEVNIATACITLINMMCRLFTTDTDMIIYINTSGDMSSFNIDDESGYVFCLDGVVEFTKAGQKYSKFYDENGIVYYD